MGISAFREFLYGLLFLACVIERLTAWITSIRWVQKIKTDPKSKPVFVASVLSLGFSILFGLNALEYTIIKTAPLIGYVLTGVFLALGSHGSHKLFVVFGIIKPNGNGENKTVA